MRLKLRHLLFASLLAPATVVMAEPGGRLAISVDYRVDEQSPERLEEIAADLCARALLKMPQVSKVDSRFNHGAFSIEIHFDEGAGAADVVAVEHEIDRLRLGDRLAIVSRSIRLAPPRPPHAFK